jgi:hypothetical protein
MYRSTVCVLLGGVMLLCLPAQAQPDVASFLYDGKLSEGAKALRERLAQKPTDDQARCVLGVVQFLQSFEKLGTGLYKYGLRTHSNFPGMPRRLAALMPENPNPEKASYAAIRKLVEDFVNDLDQTEKTLAAVKDDAVQLPLQVARVKIDLFGQGKLISAGILVGAMEGPPQQVAAAEKLVVKFDRGDVSWLRGYLHFLCAWGEVILALDTQDLFEGAAHQLFVAADTPHKFFLEEDRKPDPNGFFFFGRFEDFIDALSTIHHAIDLPIKEPARMKRALEHLEGMVAQGKEMWKYILAETGDNNEWIPNPRQTGVLGIKVTQEMVDEWLKVLDGADDLLQGKKLVPFWRGKKDGSVGVNLRKVFLNPPKRLDLVRWVQGPEATPYLEKGPITPLSDPRVMNRLDRVFGGVGFFGFALWFN